MPLVDISSDQESSEETDEEFEWYEREKHEAESYFTFTNLQRRTLMPGEQAYYCYGNRCNKFLLNNYGFAYIGNRYDSYSLRMKMRLNLDELQPHKMVDFRGTDFTEEIRLKNNQLNELMMSYLRSVLKNSYFKGNVHSQDYQSILLTRPKSIAYEKHCLSLYEDIVGFVLANLEKAASLEDDLETLKRWEEKNLSWTNRMCLTYRANKKIILRN